MKVQIIRKIRLIDGEQVGNFLDKDFEEYEITEKDMIYIEN